MNKEIGVRTLDTRLINWHELKFIQQDNFKEMPEAAKHKLKASLVSNNFIQPFYVWEDEDGIIYCLDGKHRTIILEELITEGYIVPYTLPAIFIDCKNKKEASKLVLAFSSAYAKITQEGLNDFISINELEWEELNSFVDLPEFDSLEFENKFILGDDGTSKKEAVNSLAKRFIVPPFSILDTRQGYWQERKKIWHNLFDSQETREGVELIAKSGQSPAVYELRNKMKNVLGRDPNWDEILDEAKKRKMHIYGGASIFDPVLTEICYTWFCPEGGSILDPFAGGSVRGIVAGLLGFDYRGIDLRNEQIISNTRQWNSLKLEIKKRGFVDWVCGDSNQVLEVTNETKQSYDFVFSCPPYHDLEKYSEDPADLSNMKYEDFLATYESIIFKSVVRLKENRFACFVVGEVRDKEGNYRDFVGDTVQAFKDAGMDYYNEIILINVAGSLPVRIGKQFEGYRKVGKMHQNVLVFYKGDPAKIKEEFPEIKVEELLKESNYEPNIALPTVID